jgi:hypothetical protein
MADERVEWTDPFFGHTSEVPARLAPRLSEMYEQTTAEGTGRDIYHERMHALLAVAGQDRASEADLGRVLGQAFHEGCSLADVALAAGLPPDEVVEIGKQTIRGQGWRKRL